jgi:hypothetical protein
MVIQSFPQPCRWLDEPGAGICVYVFRAAVETAVTMLG